VAAFLLTIAIFATWTVTGWPLVSLLIGGRNLLGNGLLAPLAGLATVSSAIFEANRFGLPVARCRVGARPRGRVFYIALLRARNLAVLSAGEELRSQCALRCGDSRLELTDSFASL
jgi:hypothetical protein